MIYHQTPNYTKKWISIFDKNLTYYVKKMVTYSHTAVDLKVK